MILIGFRSIVWEFLEIYEGELDWTGLEPIDLNVFSTILVVPESNKAELKHGGIDNVLG